MTASPITETATEGSGAESVHSVDTLDEGTIPVPSGTEQDSTGFHHATQNGMRFET